jgi:HEPN domain-containing protein
LFGLLYHITKEEKLKYDRKALIFLESAYLNSRYFNFSYEKEDTEEALNIVAEVNKIVEHVRNNEK